MTALDAIEKRAREARGLAAYSPDTMRALAADVLALVEEARLARALLHEHRFDDNYEGIWATRMEYEDFLAKREAP